MIHMIHTRKIVGHIFGTNVGITTLAWSTHPQKLVTSRKNWSHFWDKFGQMHKHIWYIRYISYMTLRGMRTIVLLLSFSRPMTCNVISLHGMRTTMATTLILTAKVCETLAEIYVYIYIYIYMYIYDRRMHITYTYTYTNTYTYTSTSTYLFGYIQHLYE